MDIQHDPYRRCEEVCTHDLSAGVLVSELLAGNGPHPDTHPLLRIQGMPRVRERRAAPTPIPIAVAG